MTAHPLLILLGGCALAGPVAAGDLNAPAAPNDPGSVMYTLEDLYNRLDTGTAGASRSGSFVEPAAGPGGARHTLTDVMGKMPEQVLNSVTSPQVLSGKTFWRLTGGAWGTQTGTMPNNGAQNIKPGTSLQRISAGNDNGAGQVAGDPDRAPASTKSGVKISEVAGTDTGTGGTTSPSFPVAKTGQTTFYATGDDRDLQKGVAWPNPRFTDNSNGTVTDNLTGLVWLKNANCTDTVGGVAKPNGDLPWADALTWAAALASGSCGLTDGSVAGQWRLPAVKELNSLVDVGASNPALPAGYPFAGLQSSPYWSSATYALTTSGAWTVYLNFGYVRAYLKTSTYYVWPVRDGL